MLAMRRLLWALPAVVLVPMLSGCVSLSAKGKAPELPPMNVPPPPPRVIEPTPEPLPEPVADLPPAPTASNVPRGNTRPPVSRPAPQAESRAPESKPSEPATPTQDPAPVQPPPTPPATPLRTPQTADSSNAEKGVRATLGRARDLLKNVDYGRLSPERKKAYDDAQRHMTQAEDALKEGNFVLADAAAKKAETYARELAGK